MSKSRKSHLPILRDRWFTAAGSKSIADLTETWHTMLAARQSAVLVKDGPNQLRRATSDGWNRPRSRHSLGPGLGQARRGDALSGADVCGLNIPDHAQPVSGAAYPATERSATDTEQVKCLPDPVSCLRKTENTGVDRIVTRVLVGPSCQIPNDASGRQKEASGELSMLLHFIDGRVGQRHDLAQLRTTHCTVEEQGRRRNESVNPTEAL
jgi:hypothetical protein